MELVADARETSAIGLGAVLKVLPKAWRVFKGLLAEADRRHTTTAVLIDYPEFNLRLARRLHQRGVQVVYYVSPQLWAWRQGRVRQVERWVHRMLVLFPFEETYYRRHGIEATTVGHPLVDEVPRLRQIWEDGSPVGAYRIALLPGSRGSEIAHLLPALLGAARLLRDKIAAEFVLIRAGSVPPEALEPHLAAADLPLTVVSEDRFQAAASCHLALCASGTANLELALLGTPMIVVYRLGALSSLVGKLFLDLSRGVSLVNVLLGQQAVPELLQEEATPQRICAEALRWLNDPPRVEAMRRLLSEVSGHLGDGGGSRRAAAEVNMVMQQAGAAA
jgi:lipid-A-disaccharide synthase